MPPPVQPPQFHHLRVQDGSLLLLLFCFSGARPVESIGRQSRRPPVRCCIPANPVCTLVPGSLQGKWYRSPFVLTDMGVELVHLRFRNGGSFYWTEEASVELKERLLNLELLNSELRTKIGAGEVRFFLFLLPVHPKVLSTLITIQNALKLAPRLSKVGSSFLRHDLVVQLWKNAVSRSCLAAALLLDPAAAMIGGSDKTVP